MKQSCFVGITLPKKLYEKIEEERGDLPRSYYYKQLILSAYSKGKFAR